MKICKLRKLTNFLVLFEQDKKINPKLQSFFLPKSIVETRREDKDMYHDFTNSFIAFVVGKRKYDQSSYKYLFSRYVSVSDEAFALLLFENNYDRWMDMAINNNWTTSVVMPLYTTGGNASQTPKNLPPYQGTKNTSSTHMYQGWSIQGIRRFNVLYDLVQKERNSVAGRLFEEEFLQEMQEKKANTNKKDTKKNIEYEVCRHDLWVTGDDINEVQTTDAVLESGHYKNCVSLQHTTDVNNSDEENAIDVEEDEDEEEDDNDDGSSASSEGFKRAVAV